VLVFARFSFFPCVPFLGGEFSFLVITITIQQKTNHCFLISVLLFFFRETYID
jgi:hypothetical protein